MPEQGDAVKRVAILDDEPIVCDRLRPALEKVGFEVETFTESQRLLERLETQRFDVLVTDLKMRKPDGLEVMHHVLAVHPGTKVVIITGYATVDTATEAIKSGAVDFIAKPFRIRDLRDLVVRVAQENP